MAIGLVALKKGALVGRTFRWGGRLIPWLLDLGAVTGIRESPLPVLLLPSEVRHRAEDVGLHLFHDHRVKPARMPVTNPDDKTTGCRAKKSRRHPGEVSPQMPTRVAYAAAGWRAWRKSAPRWA